MLWFHNLFSKQSASEAFIQRGRFFLLWVYTIYIAMVIVVVIEFMGVVLLN